MSIELVKPLFYNKKKKAEKLKEAKVISLWVTEGNNKWLLAVWGWWHGCGIYLVGGKAGAAWPSRGRQKQQMWAHRGYKLPSPRIFIEDPHPLQDKARLPPNQLTLRLDSDISCDTFMHNVSEKQPWIWQVIGNLSPIVSVECGWRNQSGKGRRVCRRWRGAPWCNKPLNDGARAKQFHSSPLSPLHYAKVEWFLCEMRSKQDM